MPNHATPTEPPPSRLLLWCALTIFLVTSVATAAVLAYYFSGPGSFAQSLGAWMFVCLFPNPMTYVVALALLAIARWPRGEPFVIFLALLTGWVASCYFSMLPRFAP